MGPWTGGAASSSQPCLMTPKGNTQKNCYPMNIPFIFPIISPKKQAFGSQYMMVSINCWIPKMPGFSHGHSNQWMILVVHPFQESSIWLQVIAYLNTVLVFRRPSSMTSKKRPFEMVGLPWTELWTEQV